MSMRANELKVSKGNFSVEILKHSTFEGKEAISFLFSYERFIHAEVMTHRWSRNYSSSRAIPYERMMAWIEQDPAMPLHLGSNKPGMQSGAEVDRPDAFRGLLRSLFRNVRDRCDDLVEMFNPHKEIINRYTEPFGWITGVATMGRAQLMNCFALRCTKFAHPNIQRLTVNMARLYRQSKPQELRAGQWHTPFFDDYIPIGDLSEPQVHRALVWSSARAAWCSYNNPNKDAAWESALKRHDDCVTLKHATPLEHPLQAGAKGGLVPGYGSYRSMIPGESATEFDFDAMERDYAGRDYLVA